MQLDVAVLVKVEALVSGNGHDVTRVRGGKRRGKGRGKGRG